MIAASDAARTVDSDDELLAVRHGLPVLISARCISTVTTVARRIHLATFSPAAPLVIFPASELIDDGEQFAEQWELLMHAGRGGTVLITDVEEMPGAVQVLLTASLSQQRTAADSGAARLITGTTVSLLDRVEAGDFSGDLLYRLNLIHLHRGEGCDLCPQCADRRRTGSP